MATTVKHTRKGPSLGGCGFYIKTMKTQLLPEDPLPVTKEVCIFVVALPVMNRIVEATLCEANMPYFQLGTSMANQETIPCMSLAEIQRKPPGQEKYDDRELLHYTKIPKEKREQRENPTAGRTRLPGPSSPISGYQSRRNRWRKGVEWRGRSRLSSSWRGVTDREREIAHDHVLKKEILVMAFTTITKNHFS